MYSLTNKQIEYESNSERIESNIRAIRHLCECSYKTNIHAEPGSASGGAISRGTTALAVERCNTDVH